MTTTKHGARNYHVPVSFNYLSQAERLQALKAKGYNIRQTKSGETVITGSAVLFGKVIKAIAR